MPLPEESVRGLMLHLAEANQLDSAHAVADVLGITMAEISVGKPRAMRRLSAAIACPLELLTADSPVRKQETSKKSLNKYSFSIRGISVSSLALSRGHGRRACPDCLAESRHHRFWWDLNIIGTCPRHGIELVDQCGFCDTPLSWHDMNVFNCRGCGCFDVSDMKRVPASRVQLRTDGYILGRFGVGDRPDVPLLDTMSISDALDAMERIGCAAAGGYSKRWLSASSLREPAAKARSRGFAIIADGQIQAVLDQLLAQYRAQNGREPSLTTAYGWLYHWHNFKGGKRFSTVLAAEFESHAEKNFYVYPQLSRHRELSSGDPSRYSLKAAAAECGIGPYRMKRIGIALGLITISGGNRGSVLSFEGAALRNLAIQIKSGLNQEEAAAALGIPISLLCNLVDLQVIKPFISGTASHQYIFRKSDLDDLIKRIVGGAPVVNSVSDNLIDAIGGHRTVGLPTALFFRFLWNETISAAARIRKIAGVGGALVERKALQTAIMSLIERDASVPRGLAPIILRTSQQAVFALKKAKLLVAQEYEGKPGVSSSSLRTFRDRFIAVEEIVDQTGGDRHMVNRRLASRGIRLNAGLLKQGAAFFDRVTVRAELRWLQEDIRRARHAA
jgi:hypothetical protein